MTEKDVYNFYNEKVKILYSEIEARENTLPVELLFEIHSAFDHLKRFHIDGEQESQCADRAFSHLKRGMLDAFKLKLKYHNKDYEKLLKMKADLHLIDNGMFWPSLLSKRTEIIILAKEARLYEGKKEIDGAFDNWYKTSELIDQFENDYFKSPKIQWAKKQYLFRRFTNVIIGLIVGVIGGIIVQYFFPYFGNFLSKLK
ncbi:MAG: hypothetical protein FWD28_01330 [Treponema sp.]|nr:hypothetical protein [Treponema sp.]